MTIGGLQCKVRPPVLVTPVGSDTDDRASLHLDTLQTEVPRASAGTLGSLLHTGASTDFPVATGLASGFRYSSDAYPL